MLRAARIRNMEFQRTSALSRHVPLTPLIDVVFLLVVFFMLTTSFAKTESMELTLPALGNGEAVGGADAPVLIVLTKDGKLHLGRKPVEWEELEDVLSGKFEDTPDTKILLLSTPDVSVQQVVSVMDEIYALGGQNISVSHWDF